MQYPFFVAPFYDRAAMNARASALHPEACCKCDLQNALQNTKHLFRELRATAASKG
jgi:hypothetical protein